MTRARRKRLLKRQGRTSSQRHSAPVASARNKAGNTPRQEPSWTSPKRPRAPSLARSPHASHARSFAFTPSSTVAGPTKAKTHLADDHALCILEEVFTAAEKTLIRAGNKEQVKATRDAFQEAVEPEFREVVEAASGRQGESLRERGQYRNRCGVRAVLVRERRLECLPRLQEGTLGRWRRLKNRESEEQIAREVLAVHRESYGVGAKATHVHLAGDFVLVALDVELTPAEQTLLDSGKAEAVTDSASRIRRSSARRSRRSSSARPEGASSRS